VGQFTALDEEREDTHPIDPRGDAYHVYVEDSQEEDAKLDYSPTSGSQEKSGRHSRWAVLVAVGGCLAQVLLVVNLTVLTFLLFVNSSSLQGDSEVSCAPRILEQVLMPLNVFLGFLGLCLPRCAESPWSRRRRREGLEHTIKVSECDYVVPGSEHNCHAADASILEASAIDCAELNCEDDGEPDSPRHETGTITPVEDLMHELMQVALSLCSAAPQECRGLLANCSYKERQAVHLLGQMVRNHLFPEADEIEENAHADPDQMDLERKLTPALSTGFSMSIASDGASRSEVSGEKVQRWNMLNDAVDTFLFGTSSGTDQVNAHSPGVQMPVRPAEREAMDETPESRSKTVDSDRPSGPTVTPPLIMTGPTASPTQDSVSGGSAGQSPREMSDEENPESPKSPFSVPEVSLTLAPTGADPPGTMPVLRTSLSHSGDWQVSGKDEAEVLHSAQPGSPPHKKTLHRRNSDRSVGSNNNNNNKGSSKRRLSGGSAASRNDSRRSSISSANSQFSATSFTDFNRRQSYRNGSGSSNVRPPVPGRRGSGDSQKPDGRADRRGGKDKSRFSTNSSVRSSNQLSHPKEKDKSKYNTGSSSHPSEVVRGLMRTVAAQPTEEIGGVSWGRDGCAARCHEMESERLASINLANRYRDRSESMEPGRSRRASCEIDVSDERPPSRSYTVGYSANFEQELRDACQAVFPNSPRSQAASRRASTVSLQQGDGLRSSMAQKYATGGALAIPECRSHAGSRRGSALSVAMASDAGRSRKLSKVSNHSPQPDSPTSPSNRRLSVSALSNVSARRLSQSLVLSQVPSQGSYNSSAHTGSHEEEGGGSSANWAHNGSLRSCSVSSHNGSTASMRRRAHGSDSFRFTSVGKRLRESLKKITTRGDKSKRTTSTGALSRLKKWGLPKDVQQLFVDYEQRTQEIQYRQILGVKSVDELAAEVEAGLCRIVDGEQVTRVVQVCALRILAAPGDGGVKSDLVLVQKWHRSRKGGWFRKNALPSTKLRGQEEPREAALRMLEDEFGEFIGCLELKDDAPLEELVQEKESTSYPGLLTRYVTTVVEVRINPEVDMKALADLGLGPECPDHLQGSVLADTESGETSYDWMQTKHCRIQGIPVAGVKDYTTLEVLREQEDQDSDDGDDLRSGPDPVELVRCLQEAAAEDPSVTLKDLVRTRGEILELSLEDIAKGLYCGDGHVDNSENYVNAPSRPPSNAQRFQTCPCSPSGSMMTDQTADTTMSSVAPLNSDGALPKKGSLFQILSLMQGGRPSAGYDMPPNMESLEERRRSWGEKSYALSENSVSTAMLWKMAMQDFEYDRTTSGAGSLKNSPPPALDTLENRAPMSRVTTQSEGLLRDLYEQLESVDVQRQEASKERAALSQRQPNENATPPESELRQCAEEVEQKPRNCMGQQDTSRMSTAAPASASSAEWPAEGASSCGQGSTTTGSNPETRPSSAQREVDDSENPEERARKYAERKARMKAQKSQPGKVNYGEILRNSYEQFERKAEAEPDKPNASASDAPTAASPAPEGEQAEAHAAASSPSHGDAGGAEMSRAASSLGSEDDTDNQEEKARRYAERKARMKAKKADTRPGKVNYGEILRNCYEQFPSERPERPDGEANPEAKADAAGNTAEEGGASGSGAAPCCADPEGGNTTVTEQEESMVHTHSAGSADSAGSAGSSESPKLDTTTRKSNANYGGLGHEGYWEVIRKLVAAGGEQSQKTEPDEKPMTQEEKMKLWRERKERRKSQEKLKKRPSYGSLLKKESSPVISPRTSPTPSDESSMASDLPQMKINVVGASEPCRGSTTLFGGRQSIGSQNLGFQFSAGLVHANGRLSLPKTTLEPIPSPPGSRRASELERDEEDEEGGRRRSLVADSISSPDSFGNDDVDQQVDTQQEGRDGDEQVAQDVSSTEGSPQTSGTEPASPRYSREQRSTDTLEQAMKGLGVFDE